MWPISDSAFDPVWRGELVAPGFEGAASRDSWAGSWWHAVEAAEPLLEAATIHVLAAVAIPRNLFARRPAADRRAGAAANHFDSVKRSVSCVRQNLRETCALIADDLAF
jgi:hypothetical protein